MTATFTYTLFLGILYLVINLGRKLNLSQEKGHSAPNFWKKIYSADN